ncbi:DNA topoisomerase IV [Antarcticibacterium arcticum]|uniref:DNA topoisomerase IV n=1 Tax=Antarcticibacterium arcticum TaxID=2585771 RepID=A0A5B8YKD8_9FLAO|nr:DNA topoisomerase IV [Antarcticibacterium arcticum]QED37073.1 DNA topoisomerase IV [Antarcticibacterium arcticum]
MNRIFSLLTIILIFLFNSCYSPERDCSRFKTGTFEFETYLNGEMVKSTFVRTDSIEIDRFQDKTDTSSVRWINDCEYIVKNLKPKNRAEQQPLHIKILTTDKNSYTFEYGLVGESNKQRGTVRKVE